MVNRLIWLVAIVSFVSLVSVPFFEQAPSTGRFKNLMTITRKGIIGQKLVAVKQNRDRIGEALLRYPNGDQTLNEVDQGSSCSTVLQLQVDATDSENKGSRIPFTQRKLKSEIHSKRQIPGGPDGQHHERKGI